MENLTYYLNLFPLYLAILLRTSGVMISAPVLNSRNIPVYLKACLSILLSILILFMVSDSFAVPEIDIKFIILLISEFLIGVVIGYSAQLLFAAIQLAGQSIDMQMGFGMVNVMDPQSGMQVPLVGTFKHLLAILVFLMIDGHHWLIEALFSSYKMAPINGLAINGSLISLLINLTANMFLIALKLASPLVGALFITDIIMGIIARAVPQMNVFLVGMPAKILSGFLLILMVIPLYVYLLTALFERCLRDMMQIIKVLA